MDVPRPWPRWLPRPFELASLAFLASVVTTLRARGLELGWQAVQYTAPKLAPGLAVAILQGLPLQAAWHALRHRTILPYLKGVFTREFLLLTLRAWLALGLVAFSYVWLKVSIPLLREGLWDDALWDLDARLHAGVSPTRFLTTLLADTPLVGLLDTWYGWWLRTSLLGFGFFLAVLRPTLRRRFLLSQALIWAVGCWLYVASPALGPVYTHQSEFDSVRSDMPRAVATQDALWRNYQKVLRGREGPLPSFNPSLGIAAFPSLHVGIHFLLALWALRLARPLFVPFLLGTFLTLIGSVLTGWHYAVDGYAGLLLGAACYAVAVRGERDAPPPPTTDDRTGAPEPASPVDDAEAREEG